MEESVTKIRGRPTGKDTRVVTYTREVYRDGKPGSGKYKGPDKLAEKKKLTEREKAFVDEYLASHNASAAYRASKGTLGNPELWNAADRVNGSNYRRKEKIVAYLREKILSEADELLDIQMDMIRDENTPAAVRNDAIKDRLNRVGLKAEREEGAEFTNIGEVTITIKHKQPTIREGEVVEVLDSEEEDGTDIQSTVGANGETSGGSEVSDGQQD